MFAFTPTTSFVTVLDIKNAGHFPAHYAALYYCVTKIELTNSWSSDKPLVKSHDSF